MNNEEKEIIVGRITQVIDAIKGINPYCIGENEKINTKILNLLDKLLSNIEKESDCYYYSGANREIRK